MKYLLILLAISVWGLNAEKCWNKEQILSNHPKVKSVSPILYEVRRNIKAMTEIWDIPKYFSIFNPTYILKKEAQSVLKQYNTTLDVFSAVYRHLESTINSTIKSKLMKIIVGECIPKDNATKVFEKIQKCIAPVNSTLVIYEKRVEDIMKQLQNKLQDSNRSIKNKPLDFFSQLVNNLDVKNYKFTFSSIDTDLRRTLPRIKKEAIKCIEDLTLPELKDKPKSDKPKSDNPKPDKPMSDKPKPDKPMPDKPMSDKPKPDKPMSDKPKSDKEPQS